MSGIVFYEGFGKDSVMYLSANGELERLWKGAAGTLDATDDTLLGGEPVLTYDGKVYFDGLEGTQTGGADAYNLMIFNEATNTTINYKVSGAVGGKFGSLYPSDFVVDDGVVYFVGDTNDNQLAGADWRLWTTNGSLKGTHVVTNSPLIDGQMASYNNVLYMNSDDALMSYTQAAGFVEQFGWPGLNPMDLTNATLKNGKQSLHDLFFEGTAVSSVDDDLFEFDGASNPVQLGATGLDPHDIKSFTYGHSNGTAVTGQTVLAFNGADNSASTPGVDGQTTGRGLFIASISSSTGAASVTEVAAGLDPQDITVLDGVLYFAGVDGIANSSDTTPEGLWAYDPSARLGHQLNEILKSSKYDLDMDSSLLGTLSNPQSQMVASGGLLYFDASHGNTVQGLFIYNPVTNSVSVHVGGTAGVLPYNLTAA